MATHLKGVRQWTEQEILADVKTGADAFRNRRMAESQHRLEGIRAQIEAACRKTLPVLHTITGPDVDRETLADILKNPETNLILRCIGTPPISADDLKTLAMDSVSQTAVRNNQVLADKVGEILCGIRDFKRFPWLQEGRVPTEEELARAELATATLAAAGKILTQRRTDERAELEKQVHDLLGMHFVEIPARTIVNIRNGAPLPGQFMRNALIGKHGVDAIVGLHDYRVLCIECKASNSEINSRKRLNKEVGSVSESSLSVFGNGNVVTAAVIRGVFKADYIQEAQEVGIAIFWAHRLVDMLSFIDSTRVP